MNISWLESIIYGFVAGLAEFLPISSEGHQHIMRYLFGEEHRDPVRDFFVHLGLLLCVLTCSRTLIEIIKRERSYSARSRGSRQYPYRMRQDAAYIKKAVLPFILSIILFLIFFNRNGSLLVTAFLFLINGLIIFLPDRMMKGNKDASIMTPFDSILLGVSGGLSVFSGFSRFGCTYSVSVARGASKNHALTWSLLLSIPALAFVCLLDVYAMFTEQTFSFWSNFLGYLFSGLTAYAGGYLSVSAVRSITSRTGLSAFAYYCWGIALLSFFIFLTVA